MARPTRDDGIVDPSELEKGMKVFHVVSKTIKDSLGAYCAAGQQAALTKADAQRYHKMNLIQVALPDFDDAQPTTPVVEKQDDAGEPAADAGAEVETATRPLDGEDGSEPAVDSVRGKPSRRV